MEWNWINTEAHRLNENDGTCMDCQQVWSIYTTDCPKETTKEEHVKGMEQGYLDYEEGKGWVYRLTFEGLLWIEANYVPAKNLYELANESRLSEVLRVLEVFPKELHTEVKEHIKELDSRVY